TGFDVTSTKPSVSNPLGNPTYPGWTTSGGANWIGYLIKSYNATPTYSYNFAYGGATTNASLVQPYTSTVKSFIDQVGQFKSSIASKPSYAPWTAENSLFAVWMGVNDVGNTYYLSGVNELLGRIMASYFSQVDIMYQAGARNFVFLGVPPINRSPLMLGQSASAQQTEATVISQYNNLLASHAASYFSGKSGATYVVVDTLAPFNTAIDNPTKYGAKDAKCYNSDGKTCLWFNDYHPGMAIQELVAKNVVASWKGAAFFHS
ncbi:hypothetical protein GQ43DRAFT_362971, partial [Delitschia confertaspora ATCC 74209]